MYPPGSGYPPLLMNLSSSCTTAGQSMITFSCNKQISESECNIGLYKADDASGFAVWAGFIDANTNALNFTINGALNGAYKLVADNGENSVEKDVEVNCKGTAIEPTSPVIISCNPGNASSKTAKDATAIITIGDTNTGTGFVVRCKVDGGAEVLATYVAAGNYSVSFPNIGAGPHNLYVVDSLGKDVSYSFVTTFTPEPDEPGPGPGPVEPVVVVRPQFRFPLLNSLRYVIQSVGELPNFDNRTYCAEDWPGIYKVPYYQKVCREDRTLTQFLSNYPTHVVELLNYTTGERIRTLAPQVVQQNTGLIRTYGGWLTKHPQDIGQSRLYFNGGKIPVAFVAGDKVSIQNATPAAVNGSRAVVKVTFDDEDSISYIVISYAYPGTDARISLDVSTANDALPYNVVQFACPWIDELEGLYVVSVTASGNDLPTTLAISEPIALLREHPGTHLVTWRNRDDAHGLVFSNGFICGLRVESDLWERTPGGTRKVLDLPNGRLLKLASTAIRKAEFVTKLLPPYLHEKIGWAVDLDDFEINLVEYQTRDGYSVEGSKSYALRNGSVVVEQVMGEVQNGLDLGNVLAGTGFIIANETYLKA